MAKETLFNLTYKSGEDKLMNKFGLGVQDLCDILEDWTNEFEFLFKDIDFSNHHCSYYDELDDFYANKLNELWKKNL